MADETDNLDAAERKARRLLWWATVLALVAVAVMGLDIMIKNAILSQARESQGWIDKLREGVRSGDWQRPEPETADQPYQPGSNGVGGMGHAPAAQAGAGDDAGLRPGPA
jgi:hypothetical protein